MKWPRRWNMSTAIVYMEGLASTPDLCSGVRTLNAHNIASKMAGKELKQNVGTKMGCAT